MLAFIGFDTGHNHNNQAEYDQRKDEEKPDDNENQKKRNQTVNHYRDLKIQ